MDRSAYLALRQRYMPAAIRLLVIAESPPESGLYFYEPSGRPSEPLFAAMMKQLGVQAANKQEGLKAFRDHGFVLVDATYTPVNGPGGRNRNAVILADYPYLVEDLRGLGAADGLPIVLIKKNVCELLDRRLTADGFNVLNRGRIIPFPSTGHQVNFQSQFHDVVPSLP